MTYTFLLGAKHTPLSGRHKGLIRFPGVLTDPYNPCDHAHHPSTACSTRRRVNSGPASSTPDRCWPDVLRWWPAANGIAEQFLKWPQSFRLIQMEPISGAVNKDSLIPVSCRARTKRDLWGRNDLPGSSPIWKTWSEDPHPAHLPGSGDPHPAHLSGSGNPHSAHLPGNYLSSYVHVFTVRGGHSSNFNQY